MIQVIALDLDDTLLRSDGTISPQTLELLFAWRASGGRLVIATGRPPRSIGTVLPSEFHDLPWICYNGAEVRLAGRVLFQDLISVADTQAIVERCQGVAGYSLGLEIDDVLYLDRMPKPGRGHRYTPDLLAVTTRPAAKVLFFAQERDLLERHSGDDVHSLQPLLDALPPATRALVSARYRLVQVLSRTADKVEALRFLLDGWGFGLEDVAAFGDDVNDVEMVRACGLGVAVANAVPEVHAVARQVTVSNDEDGVACVLIDLLAQRSG